MEIDDRLAARLGFPKTKYLAIERERRWLCRALPPLPVTLTEVVTDLYVTGARLRLREMRATDNHPPVFKLTRKIDAAPDTRLITTMYLQEAEYKELAAILPGVRLRKIRHRMQLSQSVVMAVDEFEGALAGLILAEIEFADDAAMAAFATPDFALREVTKDERYNSWSLVTNGRPPAPSAP